MILWTCQDCQICGFWGAGTHRLSLFGLDTLVHRPHKMAVEDMGNVCIVLSTFCFIGVCVCLEVLWRLPIWWSL